MRRTALLLTSAALLAGCSSGDDGFDTDRWRDARAVGCGPDNPRMEMYDPLRSELLDDLPARARVVDMLGPPDHERRASVEYLIGRSAIDCASVEIGFGQRGHVTRVRYVQG